MRTEASMVGEKRPAHTQEIHSSSDDDGELAKDLEEDYEKEWSATPHVDDGELAKKLQLAADAQAATPSQVIASQEETLAIPAMTDEERARLLNGPPFASLEEALTRLRSNQPVAEVGSSESGEY